MRMDGQTERQTDVTRLTVAFRNFVNASKNTVFCDVTLQSARNLGIFFRNMRPLLPPRRWTVHSSETSSPFLRNVTSQPHHAVSRREEIIFRYDRRDNLQSHIFSAGSPSTTFQAAKCIICIWEVPGPKLDQNTDYTKVGKLDDVREPQFRRLLQQLLCP